MMESVALLDSTGNDKADAILQNIVGIYERAFPNRIRSYYVVGSYADGTAVSTSDIDACIVFKDEFRNNHEQ